MLAKSFTTNDLRDYAENLGLIVKVREKEVGERAYLKVIITVPKGVWLEDKETDVMSFEISGKLEGNKSVVINYLVQWAAVSLAQLKPQIDMGIITNIPQIGAPELGAMH